MLGMAQTTNTSFFSCNDDILQKVLKTPPVQRRSLLPKFRCSLAQLRERHGCQYDRRLVNLEPGKDYDIGVYLQSRLSFDAIRNEVREAMTFNDDIVRDTIHVETYLRRQFPNTTW